MSEKATENTVNNDNAATVEKKPEIVVIDSKKDEVEESNIVELTKVYQFEAVSYTHLTLPTILRV